MLPLRDVFAEPSCQQHLVIEENNTGYYITTCHPHTPKKNILLWLSPLNFWQKKINNSQNIRKVMSHFLKQVESIEEQLHLDYMRSQSCTPPRPVDDYVPHVRAITNHRMCLWEISRLFMPANYNDMQNNIFYTCHACHFFQLSFQSHLHLVEIVCFNRFKCVLRI